MRTAATVLGWLLLTTAAALALHGAYVFFAHMSEGGRPGASIAAGAPLAMVGMLALRYARQARR